MQAGEYRLKRIGRGDRVVFYSPRAEFQAGQTLQRFTAIAEVLDDDASEGRRLAKYFDCAHAPIQPLIEQLDFIRNKKTWGVAFRRGFFEVGEADFTKIAAAMNLAQAA
jgi:hypothetical protein